MKKRFNILTLFCVCLFVFANQVAAKDNWINVRSKNFNLIGNASEKDIRGVATKLEKFSVQNGSGNRRIGIETERCDGRRDEK